MRAISAAGFAMVLCLTAPAFAQFELLDRSGGPEGAETQGTETQGGETEDAGTEAVSVAAPCGTGVFTIAEMGWPSAAILAHIHGMVLSEMFGCAVRLVPGEPETTLSSIATTRQPAIAPELWVSRQADLWNGAMGARSARAAAPTFLDGPLEAWFIPAYLRADHPGLLAAADLPDHQDALVGPEGAPAELISCPPDWACAIINRNMAEGLGVLDVLTLVEPIDRFAMDARIADAVSQRAPVVSYYWQPNALIDRLDLVALDMGAFNPQSAQCMAIRDCVPFEGSGFAPDTVVIAAAEWVFTDAPEIADYFARASMPLAEMNRLLAWQADNGADAEATARHFIATGDAIWAGWVDAEIAGEPAP